MQARDGRRQAVGNVISEMAASESRAWSAPMPLLVLGVLPWSGSRYPRASQAYQWTIRAIVVACVVGSLLSDIVPGLSRPGRECPGHDECEFYSGLLSQAPGAPMGKLDWRPSMGGGKAAPEVWEGVAHNVA